MDIAQMNVEVKQLGKVKPTKFISVHCSFWIRSMIAFTNHLPKKHYKKHLYKNIWSLEALKAFKNCCPIGKITTYPYK